MFLCCALALAACSGPSGQSEREGARDEERALRERVERLEREDAAERQRLAGEVRALRQELEDMRAALEAQGGKSEPGRLGRELDESLVRPDGRGERARPTPAPAPPRPSGPGPSGTQI